MVANETSQSILTADDHGLLLTRCEDWMCQSTIRYPTDVLLSNVVGTSLTLNSGTFASAFVEAFYEGMNLARVMYRPDHSSNASIEIDRWATSPAVDHPKWSSPIFLRFDTDGRAIIGYQRFSTDSLMFVIKRMDSNGTFEQVASWTLESEIFDISHAPRQVASDRVYVALSGDKPITFVFDSTSNNNGRSMTSTAASRYLEDRSRLDIDGWSITAPYELLDGSETVNGSSIAGFQVAVDLAPGIGPYFAISYYQLNNVRGIMFATCGLGGCSGAVAKSIPQHSSHSSPYYVDSPSYWRHSAVAVAYGPTYWRTAIQTVDGASFVFGYNHGSNVRFEYAVSIPYYSAPHKPYSATPEPYWEDPPVPERTYKTAITLGVLGGLTFLALLAVFIYYHRAVLCRIQRNEEYEGDKESRNQLRALNTYSSSLAEDSKAVPLH